MAKDWAKPFYNSRAWQKVRLAYMSKKNWLCERCGEPSEIVHHKEYLTPKNINDPMITLSFDNLESLCIDCHNKEHHSSQSVIREGYKFTEDGQIIPG